MQIHVTPRQLRLSASLHQAVAAQISTLEDRGGDIFGAHVVLLQEDTTKAADRFQVKVHVSVPGPDLLAEQKGKDLYIALEHAVSKVRKQLRERQKGLLVGPETRGGGAGKKTAKAGNPQGGVREGL
jgi:putative sigma-54 modulation protein